MEFFLITLLNSLSYGLLLFMLSSGLTLIFSMMGVLNFAHASFYMLGAYFAYQTGMVFGFWPALFLAPILVGVIGAITERYGLRKVHKFGHVAELLFTFGLAYVIEEVVHLIWGRAPVDYRIPESLNFTLFTLFNTQYPAYRAFMMLVSVGMLVSLYLVLTKTRIGLIVQASLTHPEMVQALGHNVPRVFMLVFAGGCALAGLAGVLGGNLFITEPGMAFSVGSIVFVVVVVGGMGSLVGAFIASLLIGSIQTFSVGFDLSFIDLMAGLGVIIDSNSSWYAGLSITISQTAPVLPYLLMVLMLIVRPRGLMGTRET
ncbi:MAG TPA: branched-chain amino acid ABC transporter permease [Betaproteobacteria bacterium]|nr:branched-chain amino acid ABC transporter permease [Burkholderiales bacterium]HBZ19097.1 branched-chain amino acid ABC transporter permease [Betaproteobacteria bacterium]